MTALLTADEAARLVPGERLVIVRVGDPQSKFAPDADFPEWDAFVAPEDWVALTGPCRTCWGATWGDLDKCPNPDCRDGRRIVPLWREDRWGHGVEGLPPTLVLVGRASIEVVPEDDGRNWRIVIDCVEVAA